MKLKYINSDYVPKGQLEGFPLEVIDKMLERQVEQRNEANVKVFENSKWSDYGEQGFNWHSTEEGFGFWKSVIDIKNFDTFFEKYPKEEEEYKPFDFSDGVKNHLDLLGKKFFSKEGDFVTVINELEYSKDTEISYINRMKADDLFYYYTFENGEPVGIKIEKNEESKATDSR
ncbi:hypothetical protein ACFFUE_07145 [Bergeyella porcorum]|uniref:hypothetical protein n=1 Tax=Bergeyella porcorum TaxID=1735111 RepID=UPI0035E98678